MPSRREQRVPAAAKLLLALLLFTVGPALHVLGLDALSVSDLLARSCSSDNVRDDGTCILDGEVTLRPTNPSALLPVGVVRLSGGPRPAAAPPPRLDFADAADALLTVPADSTLSLSNMVLSGVQLPMSPYPLPLRSFLRPRGVALASAISSRLALTNVTLLLSSCNALSLHESLACGLCPGPNVTVTPAWMHVHRLETQALSLTDVRVRCAEPQLAPVPCLAHTARSGSELVAALAAYQTASLTSNASATDSGSGSTSSSTSGSSGGGLLAAAAPDAQQQVPAAQNLEQVPLYIHVPLSISLAGVPAPYRGAGGRAVMLPEPLRFNLIVIAGPAPPNTTTSTSATASNASSTAAASLGLPPGVAARPELDLAWLPYVLPIHDKLGRIRIQDLALTNLPLSPRASEMPSAVMRAAVWTFDLMRNALGVPVQQKLVLSRVTLRLPLEEVATLAADATATGKDGLRWPLAAPLGPVQCARENTVLVTVVGYLVPGAGAGGAPALQMTRGFSLGNIMEVGDTLATDAPSPVWPGPPRERCGPARLADPDAYSCTVDSGSSSSSSSGSGAAAAVQQSAAGGALRCECWVPRAAPAPAAAADLSYDSVFAVARPLCQIVPVARLQPARGIGARMRSFRRTALDLEPLDLTPVLDSLILRTGSLAVRTSVEGDLPVCLDRLDPLKGLIAFKATQANVTQPSLLMSNPENRTFLDFAGGGAAGINIAMPYAALAVRGLILLNPPPAAVHSSVAPAAAGGGGAPPRSIASIAAASAAILAVQDELVLGQVVGGPGASGDATQGLPPGLGNFTSCAWFLDFDRATSPLTEDGAPITEGYQPAGAGSTFGRITLVSGPATPRAYLESVVLVVPAAEVAALARALAAGHAAAAAAAAATAAEGDAVGSDAAAAGDAAGAANPGAGMGPAGAAGGSGLGGLDSVFSDAAVAKHARDTLLGPGTVLAGGAAARRWLAGRVAAMAAAAAAQSGSGSVNGSGSGAGVTSLAFARFAWCGLTGVDVTLTSEVPADSPFGAAAQLLQLQLPVLPLAAADARAPGGSHEAGGGGAVAGSGTGVGAGSGVEAPHGEGSSGGESGGDAAAAPSRDGSNDGGPALTADDGAAAAGSGGAAGAPGGISAAAAAAAAAVAAVSPSSSGVPIAAIAAALGGGLAACGVIAAITMYVMVRRGRREGLHDGAPGCVKAGCGGTSISGHGPGGGGGGSGKRSAGTDTRSGSATASASTSGLGSVFWSREGVRKELAAALAAGLAASRVAASSQDGSAGGGGNGGAAGAAAAAVASPDGGAAGANAGSRDAAAEAAEPVDVGELAASGVSAAACLAVNAQAPVAAAAAAGERGDACGADGSNHGNSNSMLQRWLQAQTYCVDAAAGDASVCNTEGAGLGAFGLGPSPAGPPPPPHRSQAAAAAPQLAAANDDGGGGGDACAQAEAGVGGEPQRPRRGQPQARETALVVQPARLAATADGAGSEGVVRGMDGPAVVAAPFPRQRTSTAGGDGVPRPAGSGRLSLSGRPSELAMGLAKLYAAFDRLRDGLGGTGAAGEGTAIAPAAAAAGRGAADGAMEGAGPGSAPCVATGASASWDGRPRWRQQQQAGALAPSWLAGGGGAAAAGWAAAPAGAAAAASGGPSYGAYGQPLAEERHRFVSATAIAGQTGGAAGSAAAAAAVRGEAGLWGIGGLAVSTEVGRGAQGSVVYRGRWRGLDVAVKSRLFAQTTAQQGQEQQQQQQRQADGSRLGQAALDGSGGAGGAANGGAGGAGAGVSGRALQEAALSLWCSHPNLVATYTYALHPLMAAAATAAVAAAAAAAAAGGGAGGVPAFGRQPDWYDCSQNLEGLESILAEGRYLDDEDPSASLGLPVGLPSILGLGDMRSRQGTEEGAPAPATGGSAAGQQQPQHHARAAPQQLQPHTEAAEAAAAPGAAVEAWRLVLVQEYCDGSSLHSALLAGRLRLQQQQQQQQQQQGQGQGQQGQGQGQQQAGDSASAGVGSVSAVATPASAAAAGEVVIVVAPSTLGAPAPPATGPPLPSTRQPQTPLPPLPAAMPPPLPPLSPPPPPHVALLLALDVARGLAHLHRCGVLHGDLSSTNVLLTAWVPRRPAPPPPPPPVGRLQQRRGSLLAPAPGRACGDGGLQDAESALAVGAVEGASYAGFALGEEEEEEEETEEDEEEATGWDLTLETEEDECGNGGGGALPSAAAAAAAAALVGTVLRASGSGAAGEAGAAFARSGAPPVAATAAAAQPSAAAAAAAGDAAADAAADADAAVAGAAAGDAPGAADAAAAAAGTAGDAAAGDSNSGQLVSPSSSAALDTWARVGATSRRDLQWHRAPSRLGLPQRAAAQEPQAAGPGDGGAAGDDDVATGQAAGAGAGACTAAARPGSAAKVGAAMPVAARSRPRFTSGTGAATAGVGVGAGAAAGGGGGVGGGGGGGQGWRLSAGGELLVMGPSAEELEADGWRQQAGLGFIAKVADFGLTGRLVAPDQTHLSGCATRRCHTLYSAPELVRDGAASRATDVYAFAVLAWELATGLPLPEALAAAPALRAWLREQTDRPLLVALRQHQQQLHGGGAAGGAAAAAAAGSEWQPSALPPALLPWPASGGAADAACRAGVPAAYRALVAQCLAEQPSERPSFPAVVAALENMLRGLV